VHSAQPHTVASNKNGNLVPIASQRREEERASHRIRSLECNLLSLLGVVAVAAERFPRGDWNGFLDHTTNFRVVSISSWYNISLIIGYLFAGRDGVFDSPCIQ
jgi:hypothetical protein